MFSNLHCDILLKWKSNIDRVFFTRSLDMTIYVLRCQSDELRVYLSYVLVCQEKMADTWWLCCHVMCSIVYCYSTPLVTLFSHYGSHQFKLVCHPSYSPLVFGTVTDWISALLLLLQIWTFCSNLSFKSQSSPVDGEVRVSIKPPIPLCSVPCCPPLPVGGLFQGLVDSGAKENVIDVSLVTRWGVPTTSHEKKLKKKKALKKKALSGTILTQVTHVTSAVSLVILGNHCEEIALYIL